MSRKTSLRPRRAKRRETIPWWQSPNWNGFVAFVAFVGLLAAGCTFYALRPIPSVTPHPVSDPSDPFSVWFELSNSGQLGMKEVLASCADNMMEFQGGQTVKAENIDVARFPFRQVEPGDRVGVQCPPYMRFFVPPYADKRGMITVAAVMGGQQPTADVDPSTEQRVRSADITITVTYSEILSLYRTRRQFRFRTERSKGGQFEWIEYPTPATNRSKIISFEWDGAVTVPLKPGGPKIAVPFFP